jgi:beta-glucosidase
MKAGILLASVAAIALIAAGAGAADTPAPMPYADHFSPRVTGLLQQLTLDEKIALTWGGKEPVYGGQAGYSVGIPRLAIPSMRWADGANGINSAYDGTSMPVSIALAATFDPEVARKSGDVLGSEARAMKIDMVLAPFVNLARLSNSSGAFGEDPMLAGRMAAEMVKGIQATGAMTMTQQYVANVQGLHQGGGLNATDGYDFIVDDRAIHEIYLPPFESAIRAGTTSIMGAYNKVNGDYNANNQRNLVGILRNELGFSGWANSDWHANRSTLSIKRGLDFEMPGAGPMDPEGAPPLWGPKLKAAVEAGQVTQGELDRAVGRRLTVMERFGMLDNTRKPAPAAIDPARDGAIARSIATEAAVLVRNQDGALPLSQKALASLAVIGPTAAQVPGAGGNLWISRAFDPRADGPEIRGAERTHKLRAGQPSERGADSGFGAGPCRWIWIWPDARQPGWLAHGQRGGGLYRQDSACRPRLCLARNAEGSDERRLYA